MRKILFVGAAMLPVAAAFSAATLPIFSGSWDDGSKIEWVCKPGAKGTIPFRVTTPDGVVRDGELGCGDEV